MPDDKGAAEKAIEELKPCQPGPAVLQLLDLLAIPDPRKFHPWPNAIKANT